MVNGFCSDERLIFFCIVPVQRGKNEEDTIVKLPCQMKLLLLLFCCCCCCFVLLNLLFEILDPCIEHNVKCIDDLESRSPYCEYDKGDDDCDDELTPGWYKAKSPMVTHCPGLLGCGSIYPVWLNGIVHILIHVYKSMKNIYTSISHANERQI